MSRIWRELAKQTIRDTWKWLFGGLLAIVATWFTWEDISQWIGERSTIDNWLIAIFLLVVIVALVIAVSASIKLKQERGYESPLVNPWPIIDSGGQFCWYLKQRPQWWAMENLDNAQASRIAALIDGPYCAAKGSSNRVCRQQLTFTPVNKEPQISPICQRCGRTTYDLESVGWISDEQLKRLTLINLRRHYQESPKRLKSGFKAGDLSMPLTESG